MYPPISPFLYPSIFCFSIYFFCLLYSSSLLATIGDPWRWSDLVTYTTRSHRYYVLFFVRHNTLLACSIVYSRFSSRVYLSKSIRPQRSTLTRCQLSASMTPNPTTLISSHWIGTPETSRTYPEKILLKCIECYGGVSDSNHHQQALKDAHLAIQVVLPRLSPAQSGPGAIISCL